MKTGDDVLDAMRRAAKKGPANAPPSMRRVLRAALERVGMTAGNAALAIHAETGIPNHAAKKLLRAAYGGGWG